MAHHVAALHCVRSTLLTPATITSFLPLSPLYLILLTFLFILKRGLCFRSLITGCFFFFTPCSYYPLFHGCPQEEPEGGCLTNGPWAPSREGRRCQSYESWDTTPPLPLPRPLLSLSLASTPCSGAGRSCVPPNQCLHASPKTITLSSTNQRKWGDKSTPGVCACVVFHPTWHPQGHSEG